MNTDRELLELAAKAAGKDIDLDRYDDDWGFAIRHTATWWNPLTDDGDALRLAVKLYMFDGSMFEILLQFRLEETRLNCKRSDEEILRRAIVRAAAEIGKAMK